jgi:hypothetical protein
MPTDQTDTPQSRFEFEATSWERFRDYHATNPQIYAAFRWYALEARRAGRKRMGMKALVERARWDTTVTAHDGSFKLDNSMTAFYARILMENNPELRGFFETRQSRAEGARP